MGILIAIEGTDGCGKHTQSALLADGLRMMGYKVHQLSFPCYESNSSALVKMYLNGEFGDDPESVNPYAASTFFAVDRYASFVTSWKGKYDDGHIIITDRYTMSNAIHQGAKLEGHAKQEYLDWLYDLEFSKLKIPAPDIVYYLDVPAEISEVLRQQRERRTRTKPDIHENLEFQIKSRESALHTADVSGWTVINCAKPDNSYIREPLSIHLELIADVKDFLQKVNL